MTESTSNRTEQTPEATAVLVTFNSESVIAHSLGSLQQCDAIRHVIVVDNASSDGIVALVRSEFPDVQVIASPENIGFGPGNNLGLEQVATDFALVLNPDAVVTNDAVSTMLRVAADHTNAAIVGPLLENPDKPKSKVRIGSVWEPRKTPIPVNENLPVEFLSGAAMLMRMSLVRNSGWFDPNIFLFHEDDDICRSARRAGYDLILTTQASIGHLVGQSTAPNPEIIAFKQYHFAWSRLYLEEKERGRTAAIQLASQTKKKLQRKQFIARLFGNREKLLLLSARLRAVQCYLQDEATVKTPAGFLAKLSAVGTQLSRSA